MTKRWLEWTLDCTHAALVAVLEWVNDICISLLNWVDPPPAVVADPLFCAAKALTEQWEAALGAGYGEAKRHQVLAALAKQYPDLSKRTLAQAIEDALPDV
jgi:hypothetical protein